ncbi:MAG: hypothetical protein U9R23_04600 [Candidatus Cloacimonadota bacterium]|nr:hypothetical protein [Candidatus Cloacimonadota bacterium]
MKKFLLLYCLPIGVLLVSFCQCDFYEICPYFDIEVLSSTSVKLKWGCSGQNINNYELTKTAGDSIISEQNFPGNATEYMDNKIVPGIHYTYCLIMNGEKTTEEKYCSINTLTPPSHLSAVVSNGECIKVIWADNNQFEDCFNIERKTEHEDSFLVIATVGADTAKYKDYALEHKMKYYYRVQARLEDYKSNYSQVDSTGFHFIGLFVPTDYPTIDSSFEAASDYEKVILEPGTYHSNVVFPRKRIILCSKYYVTDDPEFIRQTIIDGNDATMSGVTFNSYITENDFKEGIVGLTIRDFKGTSIEEETYGGGILCTNHASPFLRNVVITSNNADNGAGIAIINAEITLENVLISYNTGYPYSTSWGSFVYLKNADVNFLNVTVGGNSFGPGLYSKEKCTLECRNTIFWNTICIPEINIIDDREAKVYFRYCDVRGGQMMILGNINFNEFVYENSIDADPLFNYYQYLQSDSPCIDTGDPDSTYNDVDASRNDMGCYGGPYGEW